VPSDETFISHDVSGAATAESFEEGVSEPVAALTEEPSWYEPTSAVTPTEVIEAEEIGAEEIADEEQHYADPEPALAMPEPEPAYASVESAVGYDESRSLVAAGPEEFSPEPVETVDEPEFATATSTEQFVSSSATPGEESFEPVGQGQPVPYLTPAPVAETSQPPPETSWAPALAVATGLAGIGALRHSVSPSADPEVVSSEPAAEQPTTQVTMPQPIQPTPAPAIRTAPSSPMPGAAPQQSGGMPPAAQQMPGGMHTAVQLTFSFEIASLQLTSSFKMSALQLKPTSKIVTMRLAPSQHPQPAMNLQVTFQIASVQLAGNSLGVVRLTPSQQQRPGISSSPSFSVAGLQLVSGAEAAPVQITPSQQGQASVHVTAGFQIATVEFSPSFEIASIILNSTSRNVSVQLPGSGPSAVEGAPVFEIGNVQLGSNGEIGMMQINQAGSAPKRA